MKQTNKAPKAPKAPAKSNAAKSQANVGPRPQQNGQTRPRPGSKTGVVWDMADELTRKLGRHALRSEVLPAVYERHPGTSSGTATTQYGRWRRFHGLTGRSPKPDGGTAKATKAAKAPKAPKASAKPAPKVPKVPKVPKAPAAVAA